MAESKIPFMSIGTKMITRTVGATTEVFSNQPGLYLFVMDARNQTSGGSWNVAIDFDNNASSGELIAEANSGWGHNYACWIKRCHTVKVKVVTLPTGHLSLSVTYAKIA